MFSCRFHIYLLLACLVNGLLHFSVFSQNYVVNGILENSSIEKGIKDSIVRRESLIVKDARVYIQLVLDEGARNITNHNRYRELSYVLPKEVVYDEASKSIFYYRDNEETEIGKVKNFLGFMPYIALVEGVRIVSSPTDAKLLIALNRDNQGIPKSVIHSEENMEVTLSKKCGQCHILEYIFSHKKWVEEDILHAFNRMQMEKEERFTEDEQKIIDLFKKYQKGEIDKGKLAEFKSLKQIGEKDVVNFTEGVYMNSCVPCHNPSKITDVSRLYSKRRCKSIVNRLKEKEPSLFLQTDMDSLASYLWEIKLKPCEN
ncbi:MAG: hypothetical protein A2099_00390 [Planctomycetes bacterium GWF2_39_10]|nr:MAG: hypothetical protein A2Y11_06765 [Planctomycetes bacterium GWC2_39_26]OHB47497.1 MAG: hypothetical protein A2099_00390 [Planctomycetes bacterium GWF2_39_10]